MGEAVGYAGVVDRGQHGAIHEVGVADEPLHHPAAGRVEPAERIVAEQHLRIVHQRPSHEQLLLMAGVQRLERDTAPPREPGELEPLLHGLGEPPAPQACRRAEELEELAGPQPGPIGRPVGHVARRPPHRLRLAAHRTAVDEDVATMQRHGRGGGRDEHALAGATRPDHRPSLAGANVQRDRLEHELPSLLNARPVTANHDSKLHSTAPTAAHHRGRSRPGVARSRRCILTARGSAPHPWSWQRQNPPAASTCPRSAVRPAAHGRSPAASRSAVISIDTKSPRALLSVSSNSLSGTLSATIPAPDCT